MFRFAQTIIRDLQLCLAKITFLVPVYISLQMFSVSRPPAGSIVGVLYRKL